MNDKLELVLNAPLYNAGPTPKDSTPDPDDCCVVPPGGGDPGPGGTPST